MQSTHIARRVRSLAFVGLLTVAGCSPLPLDAAPSTPHTAAASMEALPASAGARVLPPARAVAFRYDDVGVVALFAVLASLSVAYAFGGKRRASVEPPLLA